jgi:hypothetical protein
MDTTPGTQLHHRIRLRCYDTAIRHVASCKVIFTFFNIIHMSIASKYILQKLTHVLNSRDKKLNIWKNILNAQSINSSFAPHRAQGFDSASPSEAPVSVSWIH